MMSQNCSVEHQYFGVFSIKQFEGFRIQFFPLERAPHPFSALNQKLRRSFKLSLLKMC